jgi:transcriptional regulator with XRE-family HTH domain
MVTDKNRLNEPKVDLLIKQIMKRKGISTEQLAQKLGISENSVYVKLRGNITLNALYDIAQALDCEIADFFPVPEGYRHWKVSGEDAPRKTQGQEMEIFCPRCGQRFTMER